MRYLVTGASGFIGRHLCLELKKRNIEFVPLSRNPREGFTATGDLRHYTEWESLLNNIDVVVHSAAKVHDMSKNAELNYEYTQINTDLTLRIAQAAKQNNVKRFVFISTIKVNGEYTEELPFSVEDAHVPDDPYGFSKYTAEKKLLELHHPGVFEVVIIRPCLVYGPGVKANFKTLSNLALSGLPLPFGAVNNKRSFVSVYNLVDLIITCGEHKAAGGQVFLVSDGADISLTELITKIARSANKKAVLIPVPIFFFRVILSILGKSEIYRRLFGNLQVDISKTRQLLEWSPPYSMEQTLNSMNAEHLITAAAGTD